MLNELLVPALNWIGWKKYKPIHPPVTRHRQSGNQVAVVFVHGFSGSEATWEAFIELLLQTESAHSWDVYSLTYPSSLRVDISNVWSADPDIETLSLGLTSTLSAAPINAYARIALIAHSMGGLVVQRAVIDNSDLRDRLSHLILFGTPSAGLTKAGFVRRLKRQFRDMASGGRFVEQLRADWLSVIGNAPPFRFLSVQGDRDEFVGKQSSLDPFPMSMRRVISGNHLEIVRPSSRDHLGFQLVVEALSGATPGQAMVDGARLAVELGDFSAAIRQLQPRAESLDQAALVTLALALDGVGRSDEALSVLANYCDKNEPEALGVLAGRVKRRWLAERRESDRAHALALYESGLSIAQARGMREQIFYHAINVAFIEAMSGSAIGPISSRAQMMAGLALEHCKASPPDQWNLATQGEAQIVLGDLGQAAELYIQAVGITQSPRERQSMYSQARQLAEKLYGARGAKAIQTVFIGPPSNAVSTSH